MANGNNSTLISDCTKHLDQFYSTKGSESVQIKLTIITS